MDAEHAPRRDAEATRSKLVLAARRRFGVLGYDRTTTRDVAADAGVSVALISRYFGSKEGLYSAVLADSAELLAEADSLAATSEPLDETGRESERRRLLDQVIAGLRLEAWPEYGHQHPLLLMLRDGGSDPALTQLRRDSMVAAIAGVARMVEAPGDGTSPRGRAELLVGLVSGLAVLRSLLDDQLTIAADEHVLRTELDRLITALTRAK